MTYDKYVNDPSFKSATVAPLKKDTAGGMPNKRFGAKPDMKAGTPAGVKESSPSAWQGRRARGSNDMAKVATMTPVKGEEVRPVVPTGWPQAFQK